MLNMRLPALSEAAMTDERTEQAVKFLRERGYVVSDPVPGDVCECGDSEGMHEFGGGPTVTRGPRTRCSQLRCDCVRFRPRKTASGGAA
jgi:hypothetical protein